MKLRVGIIDYRVGNIGSVAEALKRLHTRPHIAHTRQDISRSDVLILPGVGNFAMAMETLRRNHLLAPLQEALREQCKPVLGICLGMQLFARSSEEAPGVRGLNLIDGEVRHLTSETGRIPHTGWTEGSLVEARIRGPGGFPACVRAGNIFGCQFHPEKSQADGERFLRWFLNASRET